jgi:hypothetical protein
MRLVYKQLVLHAAGCGLGQNDVACHASSTLVAQDELLANLDMPAQPQPLTSPCCLCRGTVLDESKLHPSDTWNFTAGEKHNLNAATICSAATLTLSASMPVADNDHAHTMIPNTPSCI